MVATSHGIERSAVGNVPVNEQQYIEKRKFKNKPQIRNGYVFYDVCYKYYNQDRFTKFMFSRTTEKAFKRLLESGDIKKVEVSDGYVVLWVYRYSNLQQKRRLMATESNIKYVNENLK